MIFVFSSRAELSLFSSLKLHWLICDKLKLSLGSTDRLNHNSPWLYFDHFWGFVSSMLVKVWKSWLELLKLRPGWLQVVSMGVIVSFYWTITIGFDAFFQIFRKHFDDRQQPELRLLQRRPPKGRRRDVTLRRRRVSFPGSHRLVVRRQARLSGKLQPDVEECLRHSGAKGAFGSSIVCTKTS